MVAPFHPGLCCQCSSSTTSSIFLRHSSCVTVQRNYLRTCRWKVRGLRSASQRVTAPAIVGSSNVIYGTLASSGLGAGTSVSSLIIGPIVLVTDFAVWLVEAEDIFRARGGYDPTDPRIATPLSRPVLQITTSVAVAASASVSTPTKPTKKPHQKISRPQLSSTEGSAGEIIPPSSPFASSPPRYHFDPFRGHVPSSVSSNGSIIPSSVKTELSSPVAHQQQQRGERAITISDDEPDFTLVEVNLTGTRQPDADNTPTPKAIKTKSKTKGKGRATALPVESSEDERQPSKLI